MAQTSLDPCHLGLALESSPESQVLPAGRPSPGSQMFLQGRTADGRSTETGDLFPPPALGLCRGDLSQKDKLPRVLEASGHLNVQTTFPVLESPWPLLKCSPWPRQEATSRGIP